MRAVDIKNGTGPATALFINPDVPTPTASRGEVLVKVKAFGLNRMDLLQREGHYPLPPQAPKTLGVEFAGIVTALGDAVKNFTVGDEVFGLTYGGAYAEYLVVSERMIINKPAGLSWEKAAGVPEAWITATQALWLVGGFEPGMRVLMHAGASGVGIAAIQLARAHGAAEIFVTAGSKEKIEFCKSMGATDGFNYKEQDWAEEVLAETDGEGVDLIIDPVGQSHFEGNLKCAAKDAAVVMLGFMSGPVVKEVNLAPILSKRLRLEGTTLRSRDLKYQGKLRDQIVEQAMPRFEEGGFKVVVEKVFPWTEIVEATQLMESNKTQGKIICVID